MKQTLLFIHRKNSSHWRVLFLTDFPLLDHLLRHSHLSKMIRKIRKLIYISLGTVLNQNFPFYQNCVEAFANTDYDVLMSVGEKTVISVLGSLPRNFTVKNSVDQISTLQTADIFITHCGMNSVSESLYFGVPMVLFPQHSEQRIIADRVAELGAGVKLKGRKSKHLAAAVVRILENQTFRENAQKLSETFRNAGGAKRAADVILTKMEKRSL